MARLFATLAGLLIGLTGSAGATGRPEVDWASRELRVRVSGAPSPLAGTLGRARAGAEQRARALLGAALAQAAASVPVFGELRLGELVRPDPQAAAGWVEEGAVTSSWRTDGGVALQVSIPLARLEALLDPDRAPAVERAAADLPTSVIVDARGLSLTPSLRPRLFAGPAGTAPRLHAPKEIRFHRSPEDAAADALAGARPLVIEAAARADPSPTDVLLRAADAARASPALEAALPVLLVIDDLP